MLDVLGATHVWQPGRPKTNWPLCWFADHLEGCADGAKQGAGRLQRLGHALGLEAAYVNGINRLQKRIAVSHQISSALVARSTRQICGSVQVHFCSRFSGESA